MSRKTRTAIALASAAIVSLSLVSCSGGGGSTAISAPATATNIDGVAATGLAMAGALITIKDVNGLTATRTAGSGGEYSIDVSSLTAPFVITASLQVGDTLLTLTSMVAEKPVTGSSGIANVTPLTNAIAAMLAPNGNPEELSVTGVLKDSVNKTKLAAAVAKIKAAITNILVDAGLDPASFDPVSTSFTANRKGADRVLEMVRIEVTGQGVSITNPFLNDDGNGSASVQVSRTSSALPTALAAAPAGTVLGELDHIASLFEACLADAPSVRSSSLACDAVPFTTNYLSGGFNTSGRYGRLGTSPDFTGAKFGKPELLLTTLNANNESVGFFRMSYQTAAGVGGVIADVVKKTNPVGKPYKWEITGNQRVYDSLVEARLDNTNQLNPNNTQEASKSQYRVSLRLFFNPGNTNTTAGLNVQTVRVKGPGLPAAGVVMNRSSVCGTDGYMTISNKTGALLNTATTPVPILFNGSTQNNFKLNAELKAGSFDWTKVTTNSSWRDSPMLDADLAAIPSFANYTWELWTFGTNRAYRSNITPSTPADITYTQPISSRPPTVASLKSLPWNSVDASDFLNPASTLAASQPSTTVSWKATAEPVDTAFAFGQKNTAPVGAGQPSFVRVVADSSSTGGLKVSSSSASVSPGAETAGTASLASMTGATPPTVNCSTAQFPVLDAVVGTKDINNNFYATYREQTVRSRNYNLARKYVTNAWSNFID